MALSGSFDVDVSQILALGKRYRGMEPIIRTELVNATNDGAGYVRERAAQLAPRRSGKMAKEIEKRVVARARDITGIVRAPSRSPQGFPYPSSVEFGRGPVYPKRAKVLRWTDRGGKVVFAKRAGPAKARPFMRPALHQSRPRINKRFALAGSRIAARATARGGR